jgi:hypothetical protein
MLHLKRAPVIVQTRMHDRPRAHIGVVLNPSRNSHHIAVLRA